MSLQNPTSPLPQSLPKETISKAVSALLKWNKSKLKTQNHQLFEQDDFIYLILTLKKIPPKSRTNPYKIPLPNPIHPFDSSEELCLIFDDRSKSTNKLNSEIVKKKIQSDNIPISKVIKISKLKSDYRAFEAKRKLCSSYDMFFADKRVIPLLPRLLGKEFFKKKKIPIPVELTHKNWKEQIEMCCKSAFFYMRSGTCCVVKVGRVGMGGEEIVDNVVAVINGIVEIIPKKWGNVRSFHLKLSESLALPVYQTVPGVGLKIDGVRKVEEEEVRKVDKKGGESGEESVGEVKEKSSGKMKKKTRGRIHEVQYMDNDIEGMMDDVFSDRDDDENDAIVELDSAELGVGGKKRKKMEKEVKELKKKKKKKVGSLEIERGENEDDDEPTGEILLTAEAKKPAKSKKGETLKKKKSAASSEGKGRKHFEDDEAAGDIPVSNEVSDSVILKKNAAKPKKVRALSKNKEDNLEDEDEVEAEISLSRDAKKKKKSKVGSGGIKLKSKRAK